MIPFTKMHGASNDYLYINGFDHDVADPAFLARTMSDRHRGVGADGLILVLPPSAGTDADVRMRMFNADGSESEMCGNGIRCLAKFARDRGLATADPVRVETPCGVLGVRSHAGADGRIDAATVDMGPPRLAAAEIPVALPGQDPAVPVAGRPFELPSIEAAPSWIDDCGVDARMTCVSMGNPHLVVYCREVAGVPLDRLGPRLETHRWFPRRINVHIVEVVDRTEVIMRTWERGSGITQACGTGASAVCVAGVLTGRTDRAITAHLPGGDLDLRWDGETDHVFMTGPAAEVFEGTWDDERGETSKRQDVERSKSECAPGVPSDASDRSTR